jgi:hypothetical protein
VRTIVTSRNPYLILGIPFGSSREVANIAFARKARALRLLGTVGRAQMTDLTWALNEVDEGISHPAAAMDLYRVPADPEAFTVKGDGVLVPPPEVLPRQYGLPEVALEELRAAAAVDYLRYLTLLRASQIHAPAP